MLILMFRPMQEHIALLRKNLHGACMDKTSRTDLAAYIKTSGMKKQAFAAQVGISPYQLSRWLNGNITPHPRIRRWIEDATGGAVLADGWK
jgi:transcriptional regulator with XRE-family HTH domain